MTTGAVPQLAGIRQIRWRIRRWRRSRRVYNLVVLEVFYTLDNRSERARKCAADSDACDP